MESLYCHWEYHIGEMYYDLRFMKTSLGTIKNKELLKCRGRDEGGKVSKTKNPPNKRKQCMQRNLASRGLSTQKPEKLWVDNRFQLRYTHTKFPFYQ